MDPACPTSDADKFPVDLSIGEKLVGSGDQVVQRLPVRQICADLVTMPVEHSDDPLSIRHCIALYGQLKRIVRETDNAVIDLGDFATAEDLAQIAGRVLLTNSSAGKAPAGLSAFGGRVLMFNQ